MYFSNYSNKIFDKLMKSKQVSKITFSEEDFHNLLHTCDCLNALREEDAMLEMWPISKYEVAKPLTWLIWPCAIYRDKGNRLSLDMRKHEEAKNGVILSPDGFRLVEDGILTMFKLKNIEFTGVDKLRAAKDISEVYSTLAFNGDVHYDGAAFWPITDATVVRDMKNVYYNATAEEVIDDFIRQALIPKFTQVGTN